ncbi:unnamed protein product, partial [Ilex paraguariensis]
EQSERLDKFSLNFAAGLVSVFCLQPSSGGRALLPLNPLLQEDVDRSWDGSKAPRNGSGAGNEDTNGSTTSQPPPTYNSQTGSTTSQVLSNCSFTESQQHTKLATHGGMGSAYAARGRGSRHATLRNGSTDAVGGIYYDHAVGGIYYDHAVGGRGSRHGTVGRGFGHAALMGKCSGHVAGGKEGGYTGNGAVGRGFSYGHGHAGRGRVGSHMGPSSNQGPTLTTLMQKTRGRKVGMSTAATY